MRALFLFGQVSWPNIVKPPLTVDEAYHRGIADIANSTPQAFAEILFSPAFKMFPRLPKEMEDDLIDTKETPSAGYGQFAGK
jgi:hypothetical protein